MRGFILFAALNAVVGCINLHTYSEGAPLSFGIIGALGLFFAVLCLFKAFRG